MARRKQDDDSKDQGPDSRVSDGDAKRLDAETGRGAGVLGTDDVDVSPAAQPATAAGTDAGSSASTDLTLDRTPAGSEMPVRPRKPRKDKGQKRGGGDTAGALTPAQVEADRALLAQAFGGTFEALALVLGAHWRLNPAREVGGEQIPAEAYSLAGAWQPVFERYGGKMTQETMMWIGASTVTLVIVGPRVRQSVEHETGLIGWIKRKLAARRMRRAA